MCLLITATLTAMSALCGLRFRRKTRTKPIQDKLASESKQITTSSHPTPNQQPQFQVNQESSSARMSIDVLPPPPARRQLESNGSQSMKPKLNNVGEAKQKLSSMSMKVGRSLSMSMRWSRKEIGASSSAAGNSSSVQKMKAKLEKEDSIWMKTIILGEKCRVEDEDDPVIFDDRGLKVTAYHPKVASSLPVSRSNSYIDPDAIPARASGFH